MYEIGGLCLTPHNVVKELKWVKSRYETKKKEADTVIKRYLAEQEYMFAKNDILIKYGYTETDPSI